MDSTTFRAVLFDFDGLIADTEPIHFDGFQQVARRYDITLTKEIYFQKYVGFDDRDGFTAICADAGRTDLDLHTLMDAKATLVESLMRTELQAMPGIIDFTLDLFNRKTHAMGICSGALKSEVLLGVRALGIDHCFSHIVAADEVAHSKPDPEGYLKLIGLLSDHGSASGHDDLDPGHCIVLEDTITGLKSGRAAGCFTIGVAGTETIQVLDEHADLAVNNSLEIDLARVQPTSN